MTAVGSRIVNFLLIAALAFYMGAMPFYSALSGSAHNDARLAQLPLFLLSTAVLIVSHRSLPAWPGRLRLSIAALGILAGVSCILAADRGAALRETALWMSLIALTVAIFICGIQGRLNFILGAIAPIWLIYTAFFLLAWAANLSNHGETHFWLMVPGFDNPRFLNHVQTIAIPILAGLTLRANSRRMEPALSWLALSFCLAILLGLVARASIIALLSGGLLARLIFGRAANSFIKRMLSGSLAGLFIYVVLFQGLPHVLDLRTISSPHTSTDLISDHSRTYLWKIALLDILDAPFFGAGPMHYAAQINGRAAHPHNVYLQLASEFGLPFFLLLAVTARHYISQAIRQVKLATSEPAAMTIGAFVSVAAALVDGVFSGNFVVPVAQVWICVAVALFYSNVRQPMPALAPARRANILGVLCLICFLGLQIWYSVATTLEYLHKPTTINSRPTLPQTEANSPRFWLDGWL